MKLCAAKPDLLSARRAAPLSRPLASMCTPKILCVPTHLTFLASNPQMLSFEYTTKSNLRSQVRIKTIGVGGGVVIIGSEKQKSQGTDSNCRRTKVRTHGEGKRQIIPRLPRLFDRPTRNHILQS